MVILMNNLRLYKWLNPEQPSIYSPDTCITIPDYVSNNLKDKLRPYQEQSLKNTIYMLDECNYKDVIKEGFQNKHLLYNMATGSGKTMVMASLILLMFRRYNYQNFIFFVNSEAIIQKTLLNMFNEQSTKYLFNPDGLTIDGTKIFIESVSDFPVTPSKNTIYLKLTTIHSLHNDMNASMYNENTLTYEDLKDLKVILLADEAHHYNSLTKSLKSNNNNNEETTWEHTVLKILDSNDENKLFEFTATINIDDKDINEKYSDKIIYYYDLRKYMNDGYSKNVMRIQSDSDDNVKMLDAVLLSQYRKMIAITAGILFFKPVILIKSNKISISIEKEFHFNRIIENMNVENIQEHIKLREGYINKDSITYKVYKYYSGNSNLQKIIEEIKYDFSSMNIINVNRLGKNSKQMINENNAELLNNLEEKDNPIRVIFAVAKLNEGWDVLNLYDIVRIGESASITLNATDAEAQLIGRGARYYPFVLDDIKSQVRRFDHTVHDVRILEELHYHTTNESKYLKNLLKSLDGINLVSGDENDRKIVTARLKNSFKKSYIYQNRNLFINETVATTANDFNNLERYNIDRVYYIDKSILAVEENILDNNSDGYNNRKHTQSLKLDVRYIKKAMQRNNFYNFSNLIKYIPILESKNQLFESDCFFKDITINVILPIGKDINDFNSEEKLSILENYMDYCAEKFKKNYMKQKGTKKFVAVKIKDIVKDYSIALKSNQDNLEQVIRFEKNNVPHWYIYNEAIVNGLELSLINYINEFSEKIKEKYKIMWLIRNDEKNTRITLREFFGIRGFMPDFILYLEDDYYIYQIFIEPKGPHLVVQDAWKEDFLQDITTEKIMTIDDNKEVKLSGTKFFKCDRDPDFYNSLASIINDGKPFVEKIKLFEYDE